jgi:hypothetical protein
VLLAVPVAALLAILLIPAPAERATAQEAPANEVLAIVSPLAAPACSASGSTTLLVPILASSVGDQIGVPGHVITDVVLNSLGPLFVVCASLPEGKGSRCELDDQFVGAWPAELSSLLAFPLIVGPVVDATEAALKALGLPADPLGLGRALMCSVPTSGGTIPVAPPAPGAPGAPGSGFGAGGPVAGTAGTTPSEAPRAAVAPGDSTPGRSILSVVRSIVPYRVPGGLHALQVGLAILLGSLLVGGWAASARGARTDARH